MKYEYKNPWHESLKRRGLDSPEVYSTNAEPKEYKGYLIFESIPGECFDIVRDGVCICQYAGINGAKRAIDTDLPYASQRPGVAKENKHAGTD